MPQIDCHVAVTHKGLRPFTKKRDLFPFLFSSNVLEFEISNVYSWNNMTNDMDLIYLIILTPITIAVMYAWHCIKQNTKRFEKIEEAKPYQFERDEYIPEFNEFTQMLVQRRMYKGKNK